MSGVDGTCGGVCLLGRKADEALLGKERAQQL